MPSFGKYCDGIVLLLIIISILIYSNTFSSPFQFDDIRNIVENGRIRDFSNFLDFSGTRYVGYLSFALNYHLEGLHVFGYHLINIVIHIINGLLVWWLVMLTFRTPAMQKISGNSQLPGFIAIAAALIFIAHPVQTQAVTYIVQRFASLAALFYLLSLVLFVKWRLSSGSRVNVVFYFLSIISAILAMKTKEISFTLPFVILLYEFSFLRNKTKRPYFLLPFLLTILIIPLALTGTDKPPGDIIGELGEAAQATEGISRGDYLLTQFRVIVTYIRLLLLPVNQNLDYDYPVYHSLFDPAVILSFLFLLIVFAAAVTLFMRYRKTGNGYMRLVSFGIFWFFITLSVESSIIPIRDVIFEHRLYLPSVGVIVAFSSAAAYGLEYMRERSGIGVSSFLAACIFLSVTVVPFSIATYQRNRIWSDEITLWKDVVRKSPGKARGYENLGEIYYSKGRIEESIEAFKTTLKLRPDVPGVHYNLGLAYFKQGWIEKAVVESMTAIRLKPDYAEAHNTLGISYARQKQIDAAIDEFKTAIRLRPEYVEAQNNLKVAYKEKEIKSKVR